MNSAIKWLLASDEPWTRYRTLVDLLDRPDDDSEVQLARSEMLSHPQVQALVSEGGTWGLRPIQRHNDAGHPLHKLATLADLGVRASDPGMDTLLEAILAHQSPEGAFQTLIRIPQAYGGSGEDSWAWVLCDTPTLLYVLLTMGLGGDARVQRAVNHLIGLVDENGWRCMAAPELGKFRGPGRKDDPCPIANVLALRALAQVPEWLGSPASRAGANMLLQHWECRAERKMYLFGIGTDYRKLKYPFVWYDILHVVDVLSRFPFVHADPRFCEMVPAIASQADEEGRFTAASMYQAWKGWSFAGKKEPSPWLTFLALRVLARCGG